MNKMSHIAWAAALFMAALPAQALAAHHEGVSFGQPHDGATLPQEFKVEMRVSGMTAAPAGQIVEGEGHHHLIVDGTCIPEGMPVPKDATHMHFGKGQTETTLTLAPGKHTLTLQFANGLHQSYGADWCTTISVNIE